MAASAFLTADKTRTLLACCRPDGDDLGEKKLREALRQLERDNALKLSFASQVDFDRPLAEMVRALPLPENFSHEISVGLARSEEGPQFSWRGLSHEPAFWAVLLAFAFMVAWGGTTLYQRAVGFQGDEAVTKLVEGLHAAEKGPHQGGPGTPAGTVFEPVTVETGKLGDTLFLKHNVDAFQVPPPFAHAQTISYRVLDKDDAQVTQIRVQDRDLTFLIFRADALGMDITPAGQWKYLTGNDWSAAAEVTDHIAFVVVSPGARADLETFIQQAEQAGR